MMNDVGLSGGRVVGMAATTPLSSYPARRVRRFARQGARVHQSRDVSVMMAGKKYHTVQKGEWLSSIAPQYNVSTEKIKEANAEAIGEGDLIYPGQQLVIPATGSGVKGVLVKVVVALLVVAAASGIWPTIKEEMK